MDAIYRVLNTYNGDRMSEKEELEQLKKTFEDFIHTSSQLQQSYETLKEEAQLLSSYLSNILENMNAAVMVFDKNRVLTLYNSETLKYFSGLKNAVPPISLDVLARTSGVNIADMLEQKENVSAFGVEIDGVSRWLEAGCSDFIDSKGEKTGYIVVINDKTELRKLQIKSQQEDRLRVMGELAAEVAHEIRNPLGSIELMVTLLQEDFADDEHHGDILKRIRSSVNNMNHTVTNILLYTKEIHPERSGIDVEDLVHQAESMALEMVIKKKIKVVKHLVDFPVTGDFELLKQCLANILINAAQAVEQNGQIEIKAEPDELKKQVTFIIKDNGSGIPEEMHDKIFKPFFTTKNTGTGLGLAMVKRVIESHNGQIRFITGINGTTFFIVLPL